MDRPRVAARRQAERPHVLVVSDDADLIGFLQEGLPTAGFWVTTIRSGLQVLEVFRLRQFDLIIVDTGLGSFAWLELVRRLRGMSTRQAETAARTLAPIVTMSSDPVRLDAATQQALGIEARFVAPVELDELALALHATFDDWRGRYPSAPLSDDPFGEKN